MSATAPIVLVVTVDIIPNRVKDFLKAIEADAIGSRDREPGCLCFDVLRDQADPNRFYLYEAYVDQAAIVFHKTTPHYKLWDDFRNSGGVKAISVAKADGLFHAFKVKLKSKL